MSIPARHLLLLACVALALASPARSASVVHATYLGDGSATSIEDVAVTADGSAAIVVGKTQGTRLPVTPGAFQATPGEFFAARVDLGTGALDWCTYLGVPPSGDDISRTVRVAVDAAGAAWIATTARAGEMPVVDALQPACTPGNGAALEADAWIGKLSADGSALIVATYFGGPGCENVLDVAAGPDGGVAVGGWVAGGALPATHPLQPGPGEATAAEILDGFVVRLTPDGRSVVHASHVGGSRTDEVHGVAIDPNGSLHLVGSTASEDFPDTGAPTLLPCSADAAASGCTRGFLVVIDPAGGPACLSRLLGAYLGAVAADGAGRSHVVGHVSADDVLVRPFEDPVAGQPGSGLVARVLPDGTVDFAAAFGDRGIVQPACALDADQVLHVTGTVLGQAPLSRDAAQAARPATLTSGVVLRVNAYRGRLAYGSYLGSDERTIPVVPLRPFQYVLGGGCTPDGQTVVAGWTDFQDFPTTPGALQPSMPTDANGQARRAGFLHVTGRSPMAGVREPSAVDLSATSPPLTLRREGAEIIVGWEETLGDKGSLYTGRIGTLHAGTYDHHPVTGGCHLLAPVARLPLPEGDAYFIATSWIAGEESSYGRDSQARERPPSTAPCR